MRGQRPGAISSAMPDSADPWDLQNRMVSLEGECALRPQRSALPGGIHLQMPTIGTCLSADDDLECRFDGVNDEDVYEQMRNGDREAFAELYERREPALFRYALRLSGDRFVAEEVTHEVFLHLAGGGVRFDARLGSLEAYVFGVARNLIRAVRRKRVFSLTPDGASDHDLLGDLISSERAAALYRALRKLPGQYREAVVLCDLEEMTYEDAARLMRCSLGTVRSRVHRARVLLALRLKRRFEPDGWATR